MIDTQTYRFDVVDTCFDLQQNCIRHLLILSFRHSLSLSSCLSVVYLLASLWLRSLEIFYYRCLLLSHHNQVPVPLLRHLVLALSHLSPSALFFLLSYTHMHRFVKSSLFLLHFPLLPSLCPRTNALLTLASLLLSSCLPSFFISN